MNGFNRSKNIPKEAGDRIKNRFSSLREEKDSLTVKKCKWNINILEVLRVNDGETPVSLNLGHPYADEEEKAEASILSPVVEAASKKQGQDEISRHQSFVLLGSGRFNEQNQGHPSHRYPGKSTFR